MRHPHRREVGRRGLRHQAARLRELWAVPRVPQVLPPPELWGRGGQWVGLWGRLERKEGLWRRGGRAGKESGGTCETEKGWNEARTRDLGLAVVLLDLVE